MSKPREEAAGSRHACKTKYNSPLFRALDSLPQDPASAGFSHLGMDGVCGETITGTERL
ncbi:hypothetical protein BJY01DRAFT_204416 [Aspergillus pseudoustus]|uniref:Uncharacterized protein n=1 Tax=Aspergillus pseudoustus TaxID=1810923 RepID=A0ABR4KSP2_9EURO